MIQIVRMVVIIRKQIHWVAFLLFLFVFGLAPVTADESNAEQQQSAGENVCHADADHLICTGFILKMYCYVFYACFLWITAESLRNLPSS